MHRGSWSWRADSRKRRASPALQERHFLPRVSENRITAIAGDHLVRPGKARARRSRTFPDDQVVSTLRQCSEVLRKLGATSLTKPAWLATLSSAEGAPAFAQVSATWWFEASRTVSLGNPIAINSAIDMNRSQSLAKQVLASAVVAVSACSGGRVSGEPATHSPRVASSGPTQGSPRFLPSLPAAAEALQGTYTVMSPQAGSGDETITAGAVRSKHLYVQLACLGPGSVSITGIMTVSPCDASGTFTNEIAWSHQKLVMHVFAAKSTRWEVYVAAK